jgi:hypothetical protein
LPQTPIQDDEINGVGGEMLSARECCGSFKKLAERLSASIKRHVIIRTKLLTSRSLSFSSSSAARARSSPILHDIKKAPFHPRQPTDHAEGID